jgi:tetratricopeptide (TPR) repeat protein
VALDYYLSGVKIDNSHVECIHNIACCHYISGKYLNAEKWFSLAIKVDPNHQESYFGCCVANLKLGNYEQALAVITLLNKRQWACSSYKPEQAVFLNAHCSRLVADFKSANALYS